MCYKHIFIYITELYNIDIINITSALVLPIVISVSQHHRFRAEEESYSIRPPTMADQFETLRIIDQCGKIDQVGNRFDTIEANPQPNQPKKAGSRRRNIASGQPDRGKTASGVITPKPIMSLPALSR